MILSRDNIFNGNKFPATTEKTTKIADDKEIVSIPILEESEENMSEHDVAKEQENISDQDEVSEQEELEDSFDQRPNKPLQRPASMTGRGTRTRAGRLVKRPKWADD